ncbi:MAG: hypothetical protein ABDK94_03045 [Atribacterota bacterium]
MKGQRIIHFEIPHPFDASKRILVTSSEEAKKTFSRIFALLRQRKRTSILHEIQSFSPDEKTIERGITHTERLFRHWRREYQHILGQDIIQMVLLLLLSYAIWNIGFIPRLVDSLFVLMGDYLNNYARVVLIIAPLLYMVYKKFLVGDTIFAHRRSFAFLKIRDFLSLPLIDFLREDIRRWMHRIPSREIRALLLELIRHLERHDFASITALLQELRQEAENPNLSWKEREMLTSFYEEMEHWLRYNFQQETFTATSNQFLREFFFSPFYEAWSSRMENLLKEFLSQPDAGKTQEIAAMFHQLEKKVRIELTSRFTAKYLEALINYYHALYVFFSQPRNREREPVSDAMLHDALFSPGKAKSFLTPLRTVLFSSLMLGIALFTFSVHLVDEEDFLVVRQFLPGWQGLWGERVEVVQESLIALGGKKILFSSPRPFGFTHRSTLRPQNVQVNFILREVEPSLRGGIAGTLRYFWDKGMAFFKEGYGNDFIVLQGDITFRIESPEKWKQYDFDGLGKERLTRDLENYLNSYFEKLQGTYRERFFAEGEKKAREHLAKVSKSALFKTWVRRFLYPSPLDTYRVGSVYDMYLVGLEWLLRHPRMEDHTEWKEFVEHEMEIIREKMEQEHDALIANPLKVRKMFRNPNLFEFADYPGLYQTLIFMAITELVNSKLIEDLQDRRKIAQVNQEALAYLQKEKTFFCSTTGIEIQAVDLRIGKVSYLYYVRMLQRRQNLL